MMMLIRLFRHESNTQNSAVTNLSEASVRENTSCQMQMPHSDLTSSSYNKVRFIISACVALWNSCALILTLDLLLSLRTVKILSVQKWKLSWQCLSSNVYMI